MSDYLKPNFWNEARERKTPEKPASREAQAISLLERMLDLHDSGNGENTALVHPLLDEIEAFLTGIEAEEKGL